MNNLAIRTITGVLGGAFLIFLIVYGSYSFLFFILMLNVLGLFEFYTLAKVKDNFIAYFIIALSSTVIVGTYFLLENMILVKHLFSILPLFFIIFLAQLFRKDKNPVERLSMFFLGLIYVTLPLVFCLNIAYYFEGYNYELILGMMLLISMNDVGAYFAGKSFGKTKLFERISPKKTWEGSVGGLITSLIIAFFLSKYFEVLNLNQWLIVAIITTIFGGLGDLVESMLKRALNVKDSGTIIPGHGGILDRFDALLIAAPFVYFYLMFSEFIYFITGII